MKYAAIESGRVSSSIAKLAAIAQPLADLFPLLTVHHAIPYRAANTNGIKSTSLLSMAKKMAIPNENLVVWIGGKRP
jgi:hypothetical protein